MAYVKRGGRLVSLGFFSTPEEAAMSYARTPEHRHRQQHQNTLVAGQGLFQIHH